MSKRSEHTFQFKAESIEIAAAGEAEYHEERVGYWEREHESSFRIVEDTIGAKITRQAVTGGERAEVVVDYGDPVAYRRMQESFSKILSHREAADRFRTDERVYGSQDPQRAYDLDVDDVHHFRLGGGERDE